MYFEYALEPDLVAAFCDRERGKLLLQCFGLKHQRIVSRFPDHWGTLVSEAFMHLIPSPSFIQKKNLEELKLLLLKRHIKRKTAYDPQSAWITNACREHTIKPFFAIVAAANPESHPAVMTITAHDALDDVLVEHDNHVKVRRIPAEMAKALEPILLTARRIVFVDPYFKATDPRFSEPFKAFMDIVASRSDKHLIAVELHTGIEREFDVRDTRDASLEKKYAEEIFVGFQTVKRHILPDGIALRVVIWKERDKGESLHNRYVLTELGGIMVGYGLDRERFDRSQSDDYVCLNSEGPYRDRWNDYLGATPAFDSVLDRRM